LSRPIDALRTLDQLGPALPPTAEQAASVCRLVADQSDAELLLDMLFGGTA
jgi:hypothetical protein